MPEVVRSGGPTGVWSDQTGPTGDWSDQTGPTADEAIQIVWLSVYNYQKISSCIYAYLYGSTPFPVEAVKVMFVFLRLCVHSYIRYTS